MPSSGGPRPVFRTILCPVDFSSHSRLALRYAAAVARRSNGRLTALYVNDPLLVAAAAAAYDERALARTSDSELRQFVARALHSPSAGGLRVAQSIVLGDPAGEIRKAARRLGADLIVLGTQGLRGAGKLFFGSTTARVLREAVVPVLAVPPGGPRLSNAWPGRQLIAALDLGPQADEDARRAVDIARWFGAGLLLVHVVKPTQVPRWLTGQLRSVDRTRVEKARARLDRMLEHLGDRVPLDSQVLVGDPPDQIAAIATDRRATLMIVTLRAEGGWFGSPQGSTTYQVLSSAGTPVLAVPGRWKGRG